MKGKIALIFLAAGGIGFFLMDGPLEGMRGIFAVMACIGVSYFLAPQGKRKRR